MLGETNLVGIVRVGFVAEYRLGPVRVLRWRNNLPFSLGLGDVVGRETLGNLRLASRVFEPVELARVHLRRLEARRRGFGAHVVRAVSIGRGETVVVHGLAAHVMRREGGFLGERKGVDVGAGNSRWGGAEVKYPDDLAPS